MAITSVKAMLICIAEQRDPGKKPVQNGVKDGKDKKKSYRRFSAEDNKRRMKAIDLLSVAERENIPFPQSWGYERHSIERLYVSIASSRSNKWDVRFEALCKFLLLAAEKDEKLKPLANVIENKVDTRPRPKTDLYGFANLQGRVDRKKPTGSKLLG